MRILWAFGAVLTVGGGALCWLNFYLSFVRYPLHRLRGGTRETFRWVSGLPLIGSLGLGTGLLLMRASGGLPAPAFLALALSTAVLDTGGIHWFIGTIVWWWFKEKRWSRSHDNKPLD